MARSVKPRPKPHSKRRYYWRRQAVGIARARRRIKHSNPATARFVLGLFVMVAAVTGYVLWRGPTLLPSDPIPVRFFQISTGSPGGTYFTVGRILAAAISRPPKAEPCDEGGPCGVPGLIAIAKAAPGSIANVRNVNNGRIESALAQADIVAWAYLGQRMFKRSGRYKKLRAIASLYPEAVHLVVAKQANIKTVSDLRGKRVSIGQIGSGTRTDAQLILRSFKVKLQRIKTVEVDALQASDMILKGELDAFFMVAGTPAIAVTDLIQRGVAELVPITGKPINRLLKSNSFFLPHIIESGIYPGSPAVTTVSVRALWITSTLTSDHLVERITAALWDKANRKLLDQGHAKTKLMALKSSLTGIPIPLHDGAKSFYRAAGILPEN